VRHVLVALAVLGLAACSSGKNEATPIAVNSAANSCEVTPTSAKAGTVVFSVQNTGSAVTEFYLYGAGDQIVGEVEDVGPGVARDLVVEVQEGTYTTACKSGDDEEGIRAPFTVTEQ
jgi:iron uptake system component EfeO